MRAIVGIDIGLTGAMTLLEDSFSVKDIVDIPVTGGDDSRIDGAALAAWLRGRMMSMRLTAADTLVAVFEDLRPRPMGNGGAHGNSMHSQASMMRSRGIIEGVLDVVGIKHATVQPQTWKRYYGLLKTKKTSSLETARKLYPNSAPQLARVKDHNRAESLLIAHYWLREKTV